MEDAEAPIHQLHQAEDTKFDGEDAGAAIDMVD